MRKQTEARGVTDNLENLQPHQSPTAEQDHEDDERLKPAVLHNLVAGLPEPPPGLTQTLAGVDAAALTLPQAH